MVAPMLDVSISKTDEMLAAPVLKALRDSYLFFVALLQERESRVFVKDVEGRYRMINPAVARYFGRPESDIIGKTDWELLDPARARLFTTSDQWVIQTGESTTAEVDFPITGEPSILSIHTSKAPVRDRTGQIVGIVGIGPDTARKHAEEALRASEIRFAAAQAIAHLGNWEWNLKTNQVIWSEECFRIFGLDHTVFQPTYDTISCFFHPNDVDRARQVLAGALGHGTQFKDDFRILRPNGESRYLCLEGVVTQWAWDASPLIMSGTMFDITERKRTELALRRSESNFAHAQRVAQVGSWEWAPSTGQLICSPEALRIIGLSATSTNAWLRDDFIAIIHPKDRDAVSAAIDATLQLGLSYDIIFRITLPNQSERIIHSLGEMHHDSENTPIMTGVCRDITEQRYLHEQLRSSEANLAQAQLIARIASWRWNLHTGKEFWSAVIYEILGVDAKRAMDHQYFMDFVHPDDRVRVSLFFSPTGAWISPSSLDFKIVTRDGHELSIHCQGQVIPAAEDGVIEIIGVLQDITERKRIEQELAASRDEQRDLMHHLQHLQEDERRHIAREIHDEFGAVFTAANLSLYRLANQLQSASPAIRELLANTKEMIAKAGDSLDDIVNGLHPQMLNHLGLAATLEWYVGEFQKRTGIKCASTLPQSCGPLDAQQSITLFRCLQESLTNVAKHAAASQIFVQLSVDTETLTLNIIDDGKGLVAEAMTRTDAFGLRGLSARVTPLGGTFKVQNHSPGGTRVLVTLPIKPSLKEKIE